MSRIRILCTADLHLGRSSAIPLDGNLGDHSALAAWNRIVDMALVEQADAVVVAGDVFDCDGSYLEARPGFLASLHYLEAAGIPVVAVAGNHDWKLLQYVARQAPANFHFLGKGGIWESKRVLTPSGEVLFLGWSFSAEHVRESQFHRLQRCDEECPIVGLVHGDVSPNSPYHPIRESELSDHADAWVVGHVHRSGPVGEKGIYPGSPQALDFGPGERGIHGIRWLELAEGRATFSDLVATSSVRFELLDLAVDAQSGQSPWDAACDALQTRCAQLGAEGGEFDSVHVRARVSVRGSGMGAKLFEAGPIPFMDRHSVEILDLRTVASIDPWALKDLRTHAGEAARLLIGARALVSPGGDGDSPDETWIRDAKEIVEQSTEDFAFQFNKSLTKVIDRGESSLRPLSPEEAFAKAHGLLVEQLESILQQAAL